MGGQLSRDTPFHLGCRLASRYQQGIEQEVKESREGEKERRGDKGVKGKFPLYKRMIRHAMRDPQRTRGRAK